MATNRQNSKPEIILNNSKNRIVLTRSRWAWPLSASWFKLARLVHIFDVILRNYSLDNMETFELSADQTAKEWWDSKRKKYNLGLVIAGSLAFICYVIVGANLIMPYDNEFEITLFTIFFQGIGYLIIIGIANIFYKLGYWADSKFNTNDSLAFRRRLFNTGYWFSFCFPFLMPALLLFQYFNEFRK